jgi:hypothetical protein
MSRMTDFCDIACDDCRLWLAGTEPTTTAQRRILKKMGWSVRRTASKVEDVCPACNGTEPLFWFQQRTRG